MELKAKKVCTNNVIWGLRRMNEFYVSEFLQIKPQYSNDINKSEFIKKEIVPKNRNIHDDEAYNPFDVFVGFINIFFHNLYA